MRGVVDFSTDFSGAIWYKVPFKTYPLLPYVRSIDIISCITDRFVELTATETHCAVYSR